MANKKTLGRDYPLSPTPTDSLPTYMSGKEYRMEKRQAKREHKLEAIREGKLGQERINKAKGIADIVGTAVNTAASIKSLTSKSGRGNESY